MGTILGSNVSNVVSEPSVRDCFHISLGTEAVSEVFTSQSNKFCTYVENTNTSCT